MYRVRGESEGREATRGEFAELLSALFHALTCSVLVAKPFAIFDRDVLVCFVVDGRLHADTVDGDELDVADVFSRAAGIARAA